MSKRSSELYGKNKRTDGKSCPRCSGKIVCDDNRLSILYEDISSEWNYDLNDDTPYDVSYGMSKTKWWLCPKGHESYPSTIVHRKNGHGCPRCASSKGEEIISRVLNYNNIRYIPEKYFDNCRSINPLPFDFGIPYDDGVWFLIEYHGPQHYEPVDFAGRGMEWAREQFKENKKRDKIKEDYCYNNGINLLIIPYWEFDRIEEILLDTLNQLERSEE